MKVLILLCLVLFSFGCDRSGKKPDVNSNEDQTKYLEKGQEISGDVFVALASKLQKKLKEGGVSSAIQYCNLAALPIVDSLSKVHNVKVRRTTLQSRNPANRPSTFEEKILNEYAKEKAGGSKLAARVIIDGENSYFFQPILTNNFCLQCHGTIGDELAESDYAIIKKLYPEDKAIGYKDGDLRGVWSIQFNGKE